jgi:hypothetical protein
MKKFHTYNIRTMVRDIRTINIRIMESANNGIYEPFSHARVYARTHYQAEAKHFFSETVSKI